MEDRIENLPLPRPDKTAHYGGEVARSYQILVVFQLLEVSAPAPFEGLVRAESEAQREGRGKRAQGKTTHVSFSRVAPGAPRPPVSQLANFLESGGES